MARPLEIAVLRRTPAHVAQVTAAIILAAGASTRMGASKAQLSFRDGTFLTHLAGKLAMHCEPVIVVVGAHAFPAPAMAQAVMNADWQQGQLSSLQCGLRALPRSVTSTLFTLVDHPDPAHETIAALLQSSSLIAVPVHQGKHGHPVFLRRPIISKLLALPPASSAKVVFRAHVDETDYIPVPDAAVLDDIDDPESLARFRRRTEHA